MNHLPSVHSMLPAMLVVALPAFFICVGITLMAYRRRERD